MSVRSLRVPFLVLALVLIFALVWVERRALSLVQVTSRLRPFLSDQVPTDLAADLKLFTLEQQRKLAEVQRSKTAELDALPRKIEGLGIPALQFIDGFILFTLALMCLSLLIPEYIHAKIQGILTLIFAILWILYALPYLFAAIAKLFLMVAMLLSFPFGTLAYLIIFGSFPRGGATAVLAVFFSLKLLLVILLLLAHQKFIENKGLVLYVLAAFAGNLIVSFLLSFVPRILVSITDAIAAIVVIIVAIILAIVLAIGALVSIVFALKPI